MISERIYIDMVVETAIISGRRWPALSPLPTASLPTPLTPRGPTALNVLCPMPCALRYELCALSSAP